MNNSFWSTVTLYRFVSTRARHFLLCVSSVLVFSSLLEAQSIPGITVGEFSVNDLGIASYSIPITVPPGTAGMQPALSLTYQSNAANDLVGWGWSIAGLSVITRCGATVTQDGFVGGVSFSATDRFCLDGQRLVAINGAYGGNETEYRTEVDSFAKIISYGTAGSGPEKFKVWNKLGQIIEYGFTDDSRIEATGRSDVLTWAANRIEDRSSNYLTISYSEDTGNGEYYPVSIDYTGNSRAPTVPYNSVHFIYEGRPDGEQHYLAGSFRKYSSRLRMIQTYAGEDVAREYRMSFAGDGAMGRSRLQSVQECDAHGQCFSPISFGWEGISTGTFDFGKRLPGSSVATNSYIDMTSRYIVVGDWNGDGLMDLLHLHPSVDPQHSWVALSNGDGTFTFSRSLPGASVETHSYLNSEYMDILTGDWNGDGLTDLLHLHPNEDPKYSWVALSRGDGTFDFAERLPGASVATSSFINQYSTDIQMGDWNGDGLVDLFHLHPNDISYFSWVALSRGDGTFDFAKRLPGASVETSSYLHQDWKSILTGDWNGDGLADLLHLHPSEDPKYSWIALSKGDGTFDFAKRLPGASVATSSLINHHSTDIKVGDWNGDGLVDLLHLHPNDSAEFSWVALSHGDGTFDFAKRLPGASVETNSYVNGYWYDILAADWNGDGLIDLLHLHPNEDPTYSWVALSRGDGTFDFAKRLPGASVATSSFINEYSTDIQIGDWDGDGLVDLFHLHPNDLPQFSWVALNTSHKDFVTTVVDSVGMTTEVQYSTLANPAIYTKNSGAQFPTIDLQAPLTVASSYRSDDGVGAQRTTRYQYRGATFNLHGRGFQGFAWNSVTDEATGIRTQNTLNQDFPLTGRLARTQRYLADGTLVREAVQEYTTVQAQPGVVQPFISAGTERTFDLDGSLVLSNSSTTAQDSYGNVTYTTSELRGNDGEGSYRSETANYYDNSESEWILGRLIRSTATRTNPDQTNATHTMAFAYDADNGLVTQQVTEPDYPQFLLQTSYEYDIFGNKVEVTVRGIDIPPTTTTTEYDTVGRFPIRVTNALQQSVDASYDPLSGAVLSSTDPNGLQTTWSYDSFGRKIEEHRPDGSYTRYAREWCSTNPGCPPFGILALKVENSGTPRQIEYSDSLSRSIRTESVGFDGTPIYADKHYDGVGRLQYQTRPYFAGAQSFRSYFSYDALGRLRQQMGSDGSLTTMEYHGLTTSTINDHGHVQTHIKSARGDTLQVIDPLNSTTAYSYDPWGNLLEVHDAFGNVSRYHYDLLDRKIAMEDSDLGVWSYEYDVLGQLIQQTDSKGVRSSMTYDLLGRLISREEPEGVSEWVYDTAPYGIGKVARSSGAEGERKTLSYDRLGRMVHTTTTINQDSFEISQSYDQDGRLRRVIYPASTHYPAGYTIEYHYNRWGYLDQVEQLDTGRILWQADTQNAEQQLTRVTLGNNVETTQSFDPKTGRLVRLTSRNAPGRFDVQDLLFSFDTLGNLSERTDKNQLASERFSYDALNRVLLSVVDHDGAQQEKAYRYDALGNITFMTGVGEYRYGENGAGPHAATTVGEHELQYDGNGNLVTGFNAQSSDTRSLRWTSYNKPNQIREGKHLLAFTYDSNRERMQQRLVTLSHKERKLENGESGGEQDAFSFDPSDGLSDRDIEADTVRTYIGALYEKEEQGTLITHTHYILVDNQPVALYRSKSNNREEMRYLHRDHLGSIVAITDEAAQVVERLSYAPYGERRQSDWEESDRQLRSRETTYGFTNHLMLDEVGLIHMQGRVYDPVLGRFTSPDPVVQEPYDPQNLNRYTYVLNNPLSLTDPSGFFFSRLFKRLSREGERFTQRIDKEISRTTTRVDKELNRAGKRVDEGERRVNQAFLKYEWLRILGTVVSSYVGPYTAASYSAYLAQIAGGSSEDMTRAFIASRVGSKYAEILDGLYGEAFTLERVLKEATSGGVSASISGAGFKDGFKTSFIISSLNAAAINMRQVMLEQSERDGRLEGMPSRNMAPAGTSRGWRGDGKKLAGGRFNANPKADLFSFLFDGESPLGGNQSGPGRMFWHKYSAGSFSDFTAEAWAGPHDWLNDWYFYDSATGNIANTWRTSSAIGGIVGLGLNFGNVFVASPFALSAIAHPAMNDIASQYQWR